MNRSRLSPVFFTLALFLGSLATAAGPIPDTFENLTVLPEDVSKKELMDSMKGMAMGLGVRCWHCHVGEGNDLKTFDFKSDDKPAKEVARLMMRMTASINNDFVAKIDGEPKAEDAGTATARTQVTCYTCHRSKLKPPK